MDRTNSASFILVMDVTNVSLKKVMIPASNWLAEMQWRFLKGIRCRNALKITVLCKYNGLIAFYWGPALFLPIFLLWALSVNAAQRLGFIDGLFRCWLFVYLGNYPVLITSVSYHQTCLAHSSEYPLLHSGSPIPSVCLIYAGNCTHNLSAFTAHHFQLLLPLFVLNFILQSYWTPFCS